jgi:predicted transposase/invertase (TIGR01784 family)
MRMEEGIAMAIDAYRKAKSSDEVRLQLTKRDIARLDRTSEMNEARREAKAEGRAEGRAEGEALGEARGEKKKAVEVAREMKGEGIDVEVIMRVTGLSREEVEGA